MGRRRFFTRYSLETVRQVGGEERDDVFFKLIDQKSVSMMKRLSKIRGYC